MCVFSVHVQSNLGKSGIAHRFYSPGANSDLHCMLSLGVWPPNLLFRWGVRDPHLTQYVIIGLHKCNCRTASNSVERFKYGARMWQTDDRPQTDRQTTLQRNMYTYKAENACARAIPRNNNAQDMTALLDMQVKVPGSGCQQNVEKDARSWAERLIAWQQLQRRQVMHVIYANSVAYCMSHVRSYARAPWNTIAGHAAAAAAAVSLGMGVDHRVDRGTCPPTFWRGT